MCRMENICRAAEHVLLILFFISYVLIIINAFISPNLQGDESFYNSEIFRYQNQGLWDSFAEGISHLFVICCSLLSMLTGSNLLGARLLSILLIPVALFIWHLIVNETLSKKTYRNVAWLSFASLLLHAKTGRMFHTGINDPLMVALFLGLLLNVIKYIKTGKLNQLMVAAAISGMMLWVRQFSVFVLGGGYLHGY